MRFKAPLKLHRQALNADVSLSVSLTSFSASAHIPSGCLTEAGSLVLVPRSTFSQSEKLRGHQINLLVETLKENKLVSEKSFFQSLYLLVIDAMFEPHFKRQATELGLRLFTV